MSKGEKNSSSANNDSSNLNASSSSSVSSASTVLLITNPIHQSSIISTNSIKSIQNIIKSTEHNDVLVVFDVDNVLLRCCPLRQYFFEQLSPQKPLDKHKEAIMEQAHRKIIKEKISFLNAHQLNEKQGLMELIDFLESSDIRSICLTHRGVGDSWYHHDKSPVRKEDWSIDSLKPHDIYFLDQHRKLLCGSSEKVEFEAPIYTENSKVLFKNGMLFVGDADIQCTKATKGYVLIKFFEKIHYLPKKVIFIDDILDNVSSVEGACKMLGIDYIGIHHKLEYKPKFSSKFLDQCKSFAKNGVMVHDDSSDESEDQSVSKIV